ncbi:MAG: hypothetical protein RBR74_00615 [Ignavibacteriaceae bacterium]|jgi:hypothetical protein|nr:hypothetical protein [Ignavibacteriaceae bacterium]
MKRIFILIAVTTILLLAEMPLLAQTYGVYDWSTSNYRRDLTKASSSNPTSSGLSDISSEIEVGRYVLGGTTYYARSFYQWNITNDLIPDNVIIDTVQLRYEYRMLISGNHPFIAAFYNSINDLQSGAQNNLNTLWENSEDPFKRIESFQEGLQGVFEATYDPGSSMVYTIQQALSSDKFVLGIRYQHETSYDSVWYVKNSTVKLRIVFRYPDIPVIIDQKLSNNSSVDSVGYWNSTTSKFDKYIVPKTFDWNLNSTRTLQGSQKLISSQKYNLWKRGDHLISDVTNHKSFVIDESYSGATLTSQFALAHFGITIKNSLEGTTIENGQIEFRDPWFIDYPDPLFPNPQGGYYMRNRGMNDAIFYERSSPFYPSTGSQYKGVFLGQDPSQTPTYYKIGMPTEQTISVNGQNRKFFPYKWKNDGGVTFQNEYARQTGVVFNSTNATATAILKGQLMSNDQNGISSGSQRKLVRTDNGIYHLCYESLGEIWYTHSLTTNFQGAWSKDEMIEANSKNPSIDYEGNTIKIVYETTEPTITPEAAVFLKTYVPSTGGYQWDSEELVVEYSHSYFGNAKPVIAYNSILLYVAYRKNTTDGLYQKTKWLSGGSWQWENEDLVPNTTSQSSDPSIAGSGGVIYLAWQHALGIRYILGYNQSVSWRYKDYSVVSTGS